MVYSVIVHNKHNDDWSNSSYELVFSFNDFRDKNIFNMVNKFENVNLIDYDVFVCKNNNIPNNENNYNKYKVDISIIDVQERVIDTFKKLFNYLNKNNFVITLKKQFKYYVSSIGVILKDDLCCIRIYIDKFDNYIKEFIIETGELNENDKIFSFLIKNTKQHKRSARYFYDHYEKQFY